MRSIPSARSRFIDGEVRKIDVRHLPSSDCALLRGITAGRDGQTKPCLFLDFSHSPMRT